ncbi:hypothetical protein [Nitratireductor indicus]|uniref:hypothetical protein n=1 Tax=Nitratireductor indicus TaxID=721133 RepID=UPI00059282F0|nr:hypothetical protein [Nitratireductor indicus]
MLVLVIYPSAEIVRKESFELFSDKHGLFAMPHQWRPIRQVGPARRKTDVFQIAKLARKTKLPLGYEKFPGHAFMRRRAAARLQNEAPG